MAVVKSVRTKRIADVRLPYEPGNVISCVGNLTEVKFCVNMFEFPMSLLIVEIC
jgi:hypothetical protein